MVFCHSAIEFLFACAVFIFLSGLRKKLTYCTVKKNFL